MGLKGQVEKLQLDCIFKYDLLEDMLESPWWEHIFVLNAMDTTQ